MKFYWWREGEREGGREGEGGRKWLQCCSLTSSRKSHMTGSHMLLAPVYTLHAALQRTHTHPCTQLSTSSLWISVALLSCVFIKKSVIILMRVNRKCTYLQLKKTYFEQWSKTRAFPPLFLFSFPPHLILCFSLPSSHLSLPLSFHFS